MEFSIVNTDYVEVSHQGVSLIYPVSRLKTSGLNVPGKDLFLEINEYMSTLEPHIQFEIFKLYEELRDLRDNDIGVSFSTQQKETTDIVTDLYRLLDLDSLMVFAMRANVTYPEGLLSRNSERALNSSVNEKINYFKEDYDGLVVLVLALRPLIPIWGEYISINKEATGTRYKEYRALKLISKSKLNNYPAMDRLRLYINEWRTTGNGRNNLADDVAVLDGISSDDLTDYILGMILVRRLSLCNLHATSDKDSIISSLYSYLKSKLTEAAKTFQTKMKYDDGVGRENGEELSIIDRYRLTSKLTHADLEFLKEYIRSPITAALEIDPEVDLFVLEQCLELNHSAELTINTHQRLLTQWVTSRVFPSRGVYDLPMLEMTNLISVAQAILIKWGFNELALIINSEIDATLSSPSRGVLSEELLRDLESIYPHQKTIRRQHEKANVTHNAIVKLCNDLSTKTLLINPPLVMTDITALRRGKYNVTPNLINQMAEMLIRVNHHTNKGE